MKKHAESGWQIPLWSQPQMPSKEHIVEELNRRGIWTVTALERFSQNIAREIYADADRCFSLVNPYFIHNYAKEQESKFLNRKQEYLLAISVINNERKILNRNRSFLQTFTVRDLPLISGIKINVPDSEYIKRQIYSVGAETWEDLHALARNMERKLLFQVENDADFKIIQDKSSEIIAQNSDFQRKIYRRHHIQMPQWLKNSS